MPCPETGSPTCPVLPELSGFCFESCSGIGVGEAPWCSHWGPEKQGQKQLLPACSYAASGCGHCASGCPAIVSVSSSLRSFLLVASGDQLCAHAGQHDRAHWELVGTRRGCGQEAGRGGRCTGKMEEAARSRRRSKTGTGGSPATQGTTVAFYMEVGASAAPLRLRKRPMW